MTSRIASRSETQHVEQLAAGGGVQRRGRLVEDQHVGPAGEHARDRGAAALARAQRVRRPRGELVQAHRLERLVDPRAQRVAGEPLVGRAEGDVLLDGRHEQLVVGVLEDDPGAAADLAAGLVASSVVLADGDRAGQVLQRAAGGQRERRLARAVGAEQRDPLARARAAVDTPLSAAVPSG